MTTAFWVLTAMVAWGSFLAIGVVAWILYCMLTGRNFF